MRAHKKSDHALNLQVKNSSPLENQARRDMNYNVQQTQLLEEFPKAHGYDLAKATAQF